MTEIFGNYGESEEKEKVAAHLKKHIELWKKEREELDNKITDANKVINKLMEPMNRFECKKGFSPKDAFCIGCDRAKPDFWAPRFVYPGDQETFSFTEEDGRVRDCSSWKVKMVFTACGCGGKDTCICGYSMCFCRVDEEIRICPFCGRECKREFFDFGIKNLLVGGWEGKQKEGGGGWKAEKASL